MENKNNSKEIQEKFKTYDAIAQFNFDSEKGIITVNGSEPIISVKDLKIERNEGEKYSEVTLKFDADVTISGKLLLESLMPVEAKELKKLLHLDE
ncbi:hypothetical protein FDB28_10455 [Clostridium botulinum]|nr:hypothetical protein [Clostridium botulinum]NFS96493.1 hypothetical protein [Clostridium botulinum]